MAAIGFSVKDKEAYVDFMDVLKNYNPQSYISKNVMTIYEKTSVLSLRMQQLANGAPSYLSNEHLDGMKDIRTIAMEELKQKILPFMLCRVLPTGKKEYWRIEDLTLLS
jgi:DNA-directed RNA polymerase subunit K/omega